MRTRDQDEMEQCWNAAVRWSAVRFGDRDTLPPPPKDHLFIVARRAGLLQVMASRRARRWLGVLIPDFREEEWTLPAWLGRRDVLRRAAVVLKFNGSPGFATWVLANRPGQALIHLVRHPGAVLNSWKKRHLARGRPEDVRAANIERLQVIATSDPVWGACFGDLVALSVEAAELWFWRYSTETIWEAGRKCGQQYQCVRDEDVMSRPADVLHTVCRRLAIDLPADVDERLSAWSTHWYSCSSRWKDLLSEAEVRTVEQVLEGSPLNELWEPDQVVSRTDYQWRHLGLSRRAPRPAIPSAGTARLNAPVMGR